jgi:hypothetical protein
LIGIIEQIGILQVDIELLCSRDGVADKSGATAILQLNAQPLCNRGVGVIKPVIRQYLRFC